MGVLVAPQLIRVLLALECQADGDHGVGGPLTKDVSGLVAREAGGVAGIRHRAAADPADARSWQQWVDEEVGVAGGQPDDGCHPPRSQLSPGELARGGDEGVEFGEDVVGAVDDGGVGARGVLPRPLMDHERAHQEDPTAVFEGEAGLHAGAASVSGLDHDGGQAVAAHYGVAHGERRLGGCRIRPELGDQQAAFGDLLLEAGVLLGVGPAQPRADDGDRAAAYGQGRVVRGGVDSGGQATHDGDTALGKATGDGPGMRDAFRGRLAGANDGDAQIVLGWGAAQEQEGRALVDEPQIQGVVVIEDGDQPHPFALPHGDLGGDRLQVRWWRGVEEGSLPGCIEGVLEDGSGAAHRFDLVCQLGPRTRRWLLAPLRQWRTLRLIRRHGPSLDYATAWALVTLSRSPDEFAFVRQATHEAGPLGDVGLHYDDGNSLTAREHARRQRWLERHGSTPIQQLNLDELQMVNVGLRVVDWGPEVATRLRQAARTRQPEDADEFD